MYFAGPALDYLILSLGGPYPWGGVWEALWGDAQESAFAKFFAQKG